MTALAGKYAPRPAPVDDPLGALLQVAGEIGGFKDFLGSRVADLRAEQWRYSGATAEQLRAEVGLYERALDRTARVLVEINRLGLEERAVNLAERHGQVIADLIGAILEDLDLTDEQRARVPEVVPRRLREVAAREEGAA